MLDLIFSFLFRMLFLVMWVGIFSFDVKRLVVWFSEWLEESIWQVECDVAVVT